MVTYLHRGHCEIEHWHSS